MVGVGRNGLEGNEQRHYPDLTDKACQEALVCPLGYPCPEKEVDDEEYVCRNGQEVRLEGAETKSFELQGQVDCDRGVRDEESQADEVDRPHLPVLQAVP